MEVTVKKSSTEWLLYTLEDITFYTFQAVSALEAMKLCVAKSSEIYPPVVSTEWTDKIILGRFVLQFTIVLLDLSRTWR